MASPNRWSARAQARTMVVAAALVVAAASALSLARAADKDSDDVWVHPEIESFVVPRIAVLPAVPIEGGLDVCPFVEKRWTWAVGGSHMRWLPTLLVRGRLESGGQDSLLRRLADDVLKTGRVDSLTAPSLAQALGVRGLLGLRIDLWRRESSPVRGRTRAIVGLTASLVDSSGTLLWRATGREQYEVGTVSRFTEEFGQAPADYDSALTALVRRWGGYVSSVPASAP